MLLYRFSAALQQRYWQYCQCLSCSAHKPLQQLLQTVPQTVLLFRGGLQCQLKGMQGAVATGLHLPQVTLAVPRCPAANLFATAPCMLHGRATCAAARDADHDEELLATKASPALCRPGASQSLLVIRIIDPQQLRLAATTCQVATNRPAATAACHACRAPRGPLPQAERRLRSRSDGSGGCLEAPAPRCRCWQPVITCGIDSTLCAPVR